MAIKRDKYNLILKDTVIGACINSNCSVGSVDFLMMQKMPCILFLIETPKATLYINHMNRSPTIIQLQIRLNQVYVLKI